MKTIFTILIVAICFSASAREIYKTNQWCKYNLTTGELKYFIEIKTNVVPDRDKWTTNILYISESANCATNYSSPVRLEPSTWQGGDTTNVVILNDYTGTIQVGTNFYHLTTVTNFYTTKELVK